MFNDLSYYCDVASHIKGPSTNAFSLSDLGAVALPSVRAKEQEKALRDTVVQRVCEKEVSLRYLVRHQHADSTSSSSVTSIFPPVFELHVPLDVLTYLFYAIGREYSLSGGDEKEFNIDGHVQYTEARDGMKENGGGDTGCAEVDERRNIKEVSIENMIFTPRCCCSLLRRLD